MMKCFLHILILSVAALLTSEVAADSILLKSEVRVPIHTKKILLSDLADIRGDDAKKLADVTIVEMLAKTTRLTITRKTVLQSLDSKPINWGRLSVLGATKIEIRREKKKQVQSKIVAKDSKSDAIQNKSGPNVASDSNPTLRQTIATILCNSLGADEHDLKINYENENDPKLALSSLANRFEIDVPARNMLGRIILKVRIYTGTNKVYEKHRVAAVVERKINAVVLKRELQRGQVVSESDLLVQPVWIKTSSRKAFESREAVVGKIVATPLRAGGVLYVGSVTKPRLVKSGDYISLRVVSGLIVLKTTVKALENGELDQVIKVRKTNSREELYVKVTGEREGVLVVSKSKAVTAKKAKKEGRS